MKHISHFKNVYKDKTVLITGHTGFKGSWLAIWLEMLGAKVIGYSLEEAPTTPSNFELSHLKDKIIDVRGDVRNYTLLEDTIRKYKPDIVFHLAGQPIVLRAYEEPKLTFETNTIGTMNVLEAIKNTDSVQTGLFITTDKVYKNKEWVWGYREDDQLGDEDPYSASKAAAELVIQSYRASFFSGERFHKRNVAIASTRAGNVVGGGDFADFRLVPDCAKALMNGDPIGVRNPYSTRPWQNVLEPLSGYLWLGAKLLLKPEKTYTSAWNFGPLETHGVPVSDIVNTMIEFWKEGTYKDLSDKNTKKVESNLLMLDWSKAFRFLGWTPVYTYKESLKEIVDWYKEYKHQKDKDDTNVDMYETCVKQINHYTEKAKEKELDWTATE